MSKFSKVVLFVLFITIALLSACGQVSGDYLATGGVAPEVNCPDMGADYMPAGEMSDSCVYLSYMTGESVTIAK